MIGELFVIILYCDNRDAHNGLFYEESFRGETRGECRAAGVRTLG